VSIPSIILYILPVVLHLLIHFCRWYSLNLFWIHSLIIAWHILIICIWNTNGKPQVDNVTTATWFAREWEYPPGHFVLNRRRLMAGSLCILSKPIITIVCSEVKPRTAIALRRTRIKIEIECELCEWWWKKCTCKLTATCLLDLAIMSTGTISRMQAMTILFVYILRYNVIGTYCVWPPLVLRWPYI